MRDLLSDVDVEVETTDGDVKRVAWTDDYVCERLMTSGDVIYDPRTGAVGVIVESAGWSRLAETWGGGFLANLRNPIPPAESPSGPPSEQPRPQ